jgi:acetyl-CoA carboxylase biotin carboxyl carrier protein
MNIENVRALARILQQYGLSSVEVSESGTKIRLEAAAQGANRPSAQFGAPDGADAALVSQDEHTVNFNNLIEVKSPMVGVFYSSPSPDSPPFVSIGSKIKKGATLCIIESMKLMNEITAEQDGEIVDICMRNGEIAEFGQVLFKMF